MSLQNQPKGGPAGTLTIGGTGLSPNASIYYVPILEKSFYVIGLRQILLNGSNGLIPESSVRGISVIDSGTTLIILPQPGKNKR